VAGMVSKIGVSWHSSHDKDLSPVGSGAMVLSSSCLCPCMLLMVRLS